MTAPRRVRSIVENTNRSVKASVLVLAVRDVSNHHEKQPRPQLGAWFCLWYAGPMTKRQPHIQQKIRRWYDRHQRDLPWRRTKDPYAIWISEVMLQQTQVDRVRPKYESWLKRFPTVRDLARAPLHELLQAWSGLGYNNRALRLRSAARVIIDRYQGHLPTTIDELMALPGIGEYTAKAIALFAFSQHHDVVDTNVRRVIGRVQFGVAGPQSEPVFRCAVEKLVPAHQPDRWQHALMDFGALVCISRRPKCEQCPLQKLCRAYPEVLSQPRLSKKSKVRFSDSDRFWRGRIIADLTSHPRLTKKQLLQRLATHGKISSRRLVKILAGLALDGLVLSKASHFSIAK